MDCQTAHQLARAAALPFVLILLLLLYIVVIVIQRVVERSSRHRAPLSQRVETPKHTAHRRAPGPPNRLHPTDLVEEEARGATSAVRVPVL